MERIVINSGLSGFVLLDRITDIEAGSMRAQKRFENAPAFLAIECLAQLGAFHARYLNEFERHLFLLSIKSFKTAFKNPLNGRFHLNAKLLGRSSSAFSYRLCAFPEGAKEGEPPGFEGEFLFAAIDYDSAFKKESLKTHYQRLFSCLVNGSRTGF